MSVSLKLTPMVHRKTAPTGSGGRGGYFPKIDTFGDFGL